MARMMAKAKTSRINRNATPLPCDASAYCKDLDRWALAPRTIRSHAGNLWLLGGEIIRDLNYNPALRKKTAEQLLRHAVYDDGGPLIHNGSEEGQRSLDANLPQTPQIPHSIPALSPAVTRKFPGRGII